MASSSLLHDFQDGPVSSVPTGQAPPAREGIVLLTRDDALARTLQVLSSEYNIFTVGAESDLASYLVGQNTGVAILDAGTLATPVERLTERLRAQFPELVLIVAGSVDDQSALTSQITNGTVYRFLHKPVSEQRVKLFVDAAWRRHGQENAGTDVAASQSSKTQPGGKSNVLVSGAIAIAVIAAAGTWMYLHKQPPKAPAPAAADATDATRDAVLEDLLARAQTALTNGALVVPPGTNAADLYRQAERRNPKDPRGAMGLEKVIDRLLSSADAQLLAQHIDEAQRLTDLARAINPDHVRVAFLQAQIGKERERAVLAQARQAATSGNLEQAISVLEGARSPSANEARQELEHKKLEDRVHDYVTRSMERMRSGQLIEPAQDNARFYIESARALAPNDAEVKQTHRLFLDRLVSEAQKAFAAGNADQGHEWTLAAADAGVSEDQIASLKQEEQRARTTAKTDALARLALLVNQRLSQGKVLDPPGDSAKSYLTQLTQADSTFPSAQAAREAFGSRTIDEAKNAIRRQDYAGAQRWLTESLEAGVDQASINAVSNDIRAAQDEEAKEHAKKVAEAAAAPPALELAHYVPPTFPPEARKNAESGWVDVEFIVQTDGSISEPSVVEAEPKGLFDESALEAVRKWRYRPILRDGKPINHRARVRVRFALQK
jgi:TonB family protein